MTPTDFEARLVGWLEAEASSGEPGGTLEAILAVTAQTHQESPALRLRGRWRTSVIPQAPSGLRLVLGAALLIATLLAIALVGAGLLLPRTAVRDGLVALAVDGAIWVTEPDGTGLRRLTDSADDAHGPSWSPDGERLAYLSGAQEEAIVRLVDPAGMTLGTLRPPTGLPIAAGATIAGWSPDGAELTVPVMDDAELRVAILDVEGGTSRILDIEPAYTFGWSPDGRLMGIKSLGVLSADTAVVAPDGSGLRTLLQRGRLLEAVSFTPDSSAVLFSQPSGPRAFDGDIVTIDIDDGALRTLVDGATNDVAPALSPDGGRLAFHRSRRVTIGSAFERRDGEDPSSDLYVMTTSTVSPELRVADVAPSSTWSPSGAAIAAFTPDGRTLLIVPADGSAAPTHVDLPGPAEAVSWQPLGP